MASQDLISKARSAYDALNRHDLNTLLSMFSDRFEYLDIALNRRVQGHEGFKQYFQELLTAFPDAKVEIKNIVGASDYIVAEYVFSGTNTGVSISHALSRQFPATNKRVEIPVCEVSRYENGKVISIHAYSDALTMIRQLGLLSQLSHLKAA